MNEYPDSHVGITAVLACMAIGDPDSDLSEDGKNELAETILKHMQDDDDAMEQWELMRQEMGTQDERTVQDLGIADIREFCEKIYEAVQEGVLVLPLGHGAHLPEDQLSETECARFNALAEGMTQRMVDAGVLSPEANAKADYFVLATGVLLNLQENLDRLHFHDEAEILGEAVGVVQRAYVLWLRSQATWN